MPKNGPITVVQVTDTHLYADPDGELLGVHTRHSLSRVVSDVRARFSAADAILLTGDLVHDGSAAGYRALRQMFADFESPCFFIPGNHDIPEVMETELVQGNMRKQKSVILGNWKCILLDTYYKDQVGGKLSSADLGFLQEELDNAGTNHVLLALHHPPLAVGCEWLDNIALQNSEEFLSMIFPYSQIRAIIFGHVHQSFSTSLQNILMLGSPSTCAQFLPGQKEFALDEAVPAYRVLRLLADGSIQTEVIQVAVS